MGEKINDRSSSERATKLADFVAASPKNRTLHDKWFLGNATTEDRDLIVTALRSLAAQDQKPTSVRLEARPAGSDKDWIEIFPSQLSGMAKIGHDVRAIETDTPPAAGWNIPEQITPELACILEQCGPPEMQTPEAVSTLVRDYQPIWAEIV